MRWAALLFLICVSVDFSNPLLPGSQRFSPEEPIDAVHAERFRLDGQVPEVAGKARPYRLVSDEVIQVSVRVTRTSQTRIPRRLPVRRARPDSTESAPSPDGP